MGSRMETALFRIESSYISGNCGVIYPFCLITDYITSSRVINKNDEHSMCRCIYINTRNSQNLSMLEITETGGGWLKNPSNGKIEKKESK